MYLLVSSGVGSVGIKYNSDSYVALTSYFHCRYLEKDVGNHIGPLPSFLPTI